MLVQDPLSKYPRLGKYALFFPLFPDIFMNTMLKK